MNYQNNKRLQILHEDRKPVVAGKFYPSTSTELKQEIKTIFDESPNYFISEELRAIIVPHAGYVFSGTVAGTAYKALKKYDTPVNVFIIGSSHHVHFGGASIYNKGDYITPVGKVSVNRDIANKLFKSNENISYVPEAHNLEHTIEVQLPFLQYLYGDALRIVPIIVGTQSIKVCQSIGKTLKPYFKHENLFVISSDFSHYPSYHDAKYCDALTAKSILSNNTTELLKTIETIKSKKLEDLATPICGLSAILTLLSITENEKVNYKLFDYKNSGDHPYFGDKTRVVGYWSIGVTSKAKELVLSQNEKETLLEIARDAIYNQLNIRKIRNQYQVEESSILNDRLGVFVSLYVKNKLRGCIGRFINDIPLHKLTAKMSVAAATVDSRFNPIKVNEMNDLKIEISVLSELDKVQDIREIIPGKHGIYLLKDNRSGTFLPQVAEKNNWDTEEMLAQCTEIKLGLEREDWKDAEIFKYTALVFSNGAD